MLDKTRAQFMGLLKKYANLDHDDLKTWSGPANLVTLARLLLAWVPGVIILATKQPGWWWTAAILFVLIAATDALDGYLARKRDPITGLDRTTELGKFLDPLVDKVLVATALVALCLVTPVLCVPTAFIIL